MNHIQASTRLLQVKQAAPRLSKLFPIVSKFVSEVPGTKAISTTIPGMPGAQILTKFPFSTSTQRIGQASIPNAWQGLGLGRKMYGATIRKAFDDYISTGRNRFFTSDNTGGTSGSATRVWEALMKRGWPIQRTPRFTPTSEAQYGVDMEHLKTFFKDSPARLAPTATPAPQL